MAIVVGRVCSHITAGARKLLVHQVEKYSWGFSLWSKNKSVVADGILHLRSATLLGSIYHYPLMSAFLEIHLPRTWAGKKLCNAEMYDFFFILKLVASIFYYFIQWPTNTQLIDKLLVLYYSYMFRHYTHTVHIYYGLYIRPIRRTSWIATTKWFGRFYYK